MSKKTLTNRDTETPTHRHTQTLRLTQANTHTHMDKKALTKQHYVKLSSKLNYDRQGHRYGNIESTLSEVSSQNEQNTNKRK